MLTAVLKNAYILRDSGFVKSDLFINNGIIADIFTDCAFTGNTEIIDFSGKYIFPGFADVHVHLREPGFSYKETIESGTSAAARGGYTDICSMPNLNPMPDNAENLKIQLDIIEKTAKVRVHPYGTITRGEEGGELSDMAEMKKAVAFTDDGRGVQSQEMMRAAMLNAKRLGKIIAAHCEDNDLLCGGYIHEGEYARLHSHRGICSESEWGQIKRDLMLASDTGCAYHICHISTAESVDLIRNAKRAGVDVTCETAPHYLVLCDEDLEEDGRFKMNPPLRSARDREALIEGIIDGTIDMIATDHAPHSAEEKSRGLEKSAMGVVGLEIAFPALYTHLVKTGIITLEKLISLMQENPCNRFGLGREKGITVGTTADLCVFDLDCCYNIDPGEFLSMGRATPFEGDRVYGRSLMTVCGGKTVWCDKSVKEIAIE